MTGTPPPAPGRDELGEDVPVPDTYAEQMRRRAVSLREEAKTARERLATAEQRVRRECAAELREALFEGRYGSGWDLAERMHAVANRWDGRAVTDPIVAGQSAADRLIAALSAPAGPGWTVFPSPEQVVMVLRALADYTALHSALRWRTDEGDPDPALAVGRWLHAVADHLERRR